MLGAPAPDRKHDGCICDRCQDGPAKDLMADRYFTERGERQRSDDQIACSQRPNERERARIRGGKTVLTGGDPRSDHPSNADQNERDAEGERERKAHTWLGRHKSRKSADLKERFGQKDERAGMRSVSRPLRVRQARATRPIQPGSVNHARFAKGGKLTLWSEVSVPQPRSELGGLGDPIVPTISSGIAGPLLVAHLPRMWLEGVLSATARLPRGYDRYQPAFDALVLEGLGIDRTAFAAHLATVPHYMQTEAWVSANARNLTSESIAAVNHAIRTAPAPQPKLEMDASDTPAPMKRATVIEQADLADWHAVYTFVMRRIGTPLDPIFPAISSRSHGPLGVDHLPRLWIKNILKKAGALPLGYRSGWYRCVKRGLSLVPAGVDTITYRNIGLSVPLSAAYIEAELPDYPTYERWVREHAKKLDATSIHAHNSVTSMTRPAKASAEKVEVGWDNPSNDGYLIDDLLDWKYIHQSITARRTDP